jgi:hypothetical protein
VSETGLTGGAGRWWTREGIDAQGHVGEDLDAIIDALAWQEGSPLLRGCYHELGMLAVPVAVLRTSLRVTVWRESASQPLVLPIAPRPTPGLLLGVGPQRTGRPMRVYALVVATFAPSLTVLAHDVSDENGDWPRGARWR